MGLTEWAPPNNGILVQAPRPASIAFLEARSTPSDWLRMQNLCDYTFQIEPEITPELGVRGRLRGIVHCWMGAQLRFWDIRELRIGVTNKVLDRLIRAVVRVGLAEGTPGAAIKWLRETGALVIADFNANNLRINMPFGGAGNGSEALVATIKNLSDVVFAQGAHVQQVIILHNYLVH